MRIAKLVRSGLLFALAACSASPTGPGISPNAQPATELVLPGPSGAPPPSPPDAARELKGVDTSGMSRRENEQLWRLLTALYSPCPDQAVSLEACVREARPCGACTPAAQLLAAKVREGANFAQGQAIYAMRFGPNVKTVDVTGSPARGAPHPKVVIAEWFDFECPHCRLAGPELDQVVDKHLADVQLVKKFYPLKFHGRAEPAARAAIAAHRQGKYFEMEKLIFDHHDKIGDPDLLEYAKGLRLDLARFQADLAAPETTKLLERDHEEAEKAGLEGTPFILVNGRPFELGLFHIDRDLEPWIATEIALGAKPR